MDTTGTTARQRVGLTIAGLLCVGNIAGIATPTGEGEAGPPFDVLLIGAVIGVVGLIATVVAWRTGERRWLRVVGACLVLEVLGALPAFFVDVPAAVRLLVGVVTLITLVACVLLLSPIRQGLTGQGAS